MNCESLLVLVEMTFSHPLKESDAIVVISGDGYNMLPHVLSLWEDGWAPKIIVSGGTCKHGKKITGPDATKLKKWLIKHGVPEKYIIVEKQSKHTGEQACNVMEIIKNFNMKRIILVTSHFHQTRAFLTFLKASIKASYQLEIISSPVINLAWFKKSMYLPYTRFEWGMQELGRIIKYQKGGWVATLKETCQYFRRIQR